MRISDWSSDVCSSDLVDSAAEHIDARGLGFFDNCVRVDGDLGQFLVGDDHGFAREGDKIFRHVTACHVRITRNKSPKIATHASAILSQSAIAKRRASTEIHPNATEPANNTDWQTQAQSIPGPPTRPKPKH